MEEIITLDGKQFKLTTDRPLTALERQQTISQIRQQTGCSSCHQPRTMTAGFADIQSMLTCVSGTKSSGDVITLSASPGGDAGVVSPYYVRFFRKSAPGTYTELGAVRTVIEAGTTSTTIALVDADIIGAVGDSSASVPVIASQITVANKALGYDIVDAEDSLTGFAAGVIRVAVTTGDSCPTGPQGCVEFCDVNLACVAPTCNFTVT